MDQFFASANNVIAFLLLHTWRRGNGTLSTASIRLVRTKPYRLPDVKQPYKTRISHGFQTAFEPHNIVLTARGNGLRQEALTNFIVSPHQAVNRKIKNDHFWKDAHTDPIVRTTRIQTDIENRCRN